MTSKEALENVKKAPSFMGGNPRYWTYLNSTTPFLEDINIIEQDLNRLETFNYIAEQNVELREENAKLKKVIEIIKEKKVDIPKILANDFNNYNALAVFFGFKQLTQEEYELLKEVLINGG